MVFDIMAYGLAAFCGFILGWLTHIGYEIIKITSEPEKKKQPKGEGKE